MTSKPSPKIKGVLFDLDGTLLDTAPDFKASLDPIRKAHNQSPLDLTDFRACVSRGTPGMLEHAFNVTPKSPNYNTLKQQFHDIYIKLMGRYTEFFPEAESLLQYLLSQKLPWGIVTNKPKRFTELLIKLFPPLPDAHSIISGDTLATQKPDPLPLLHACQQLKLAPEECLYVGDANTDIIASKRAGMSSAYAEYGYVPLEADPKSYQADYYVKSPSQILALLK